MEERIYDYWAATLQDGYMGNLVNIVKNAGGARALYGLSRSELVRRCRISEKLAGYIEDHRPDIRSLEEEYYRMQENEVHYVNRSDPDFPEKLKNIPCSPYGLFVKGELPGSLTPSVAIVGARECTEYGRLMAEYFASRLAKEGVQVISGMAAGIDGIAQSAALNSGGKSQG